MSMCCCPRCGSDNILEDNGLFIEKMTCRRCGYVHSAIGSIAPVIGITTLVLSPFLLMAAIDATTSLFTPHDPCLAPDRYTDGF